ncbi:hypothetical protein AJ79_02720 [Helicocarpus griseus UAMH5409]|uniref:Peroxin 11B n=1 Tax=Helicocarpus griseus UAMH5409 TaxID=1447875 RepID=A0A2B7Y2K2_9EURO|nr:hypothetical protein AJ79_02720 [Helicocarpus griseus UAMH5409]
MPSLLKQFTNYTNSGLGLENFLRLVQSICQVVAASTASATEAEPWSIAWRNLALSRRYFRYFQFVNCFERAWSVFSGQDTSSTGGYVLRTLDVGRWSCLGGYLFLEAFTILHALNIYPTHWAKQTLLESFKLWFYSMIFAMVGIIWQLLVPASSPGSSTTKKPTEKEGAVVTKEVEKEKVISQGDDKADSTKTEKNRTITTTGDKDTTSNTTRLLTELVILCCDILIPGQTLGWIDVDFLTVSSAAVLSSLLMGKDKWVKVQNQGAL